MIIVRAMSFVRAKRKVMVKTEGGHPRRMSVWFYRSAAWALISVAMAIAAPYGLEMAYGFWERLGYWSSVIAAAILIASFIRYTVLRRFGAETLGLLLLIALLQTIVLGPAIWLANNYIFRFDVSGPRWLAELTLIMLLVCLCVALVRYELARLRNFAKRETGSLPAASEEDNQPPRPAFLDRGDAPLGGEVLVVSAADHYLDILTTEGRGRVLMRFRDALTELEGMPGYRIHRSHWVARAELVRVRPDGRRHIADLRSGKALPVSDAYIEDLRDAGLLSDMALGNRTGGEPRRSTSAPAPTRPVSSGRSHERPPV